MAFQTGSQIDPRLMQMDYSGFTNAANIRANAMAQLGQKIGSVIEDYSERREEKIEKDNFEAALLPFATKMTGGDAAEAKKLIKVFSGKPKNRDTILGLMQLEQEQEKANMTQDILGRYSSGEISAQEAFESGYVTPGDLADIDKAMPKYSAVDIAKNLEAFEGVTGYKWDPSINSFRASTGITDFGKGNEIIPNSDPRVSSYFASPQGRALLSSGMQVEGTMTDAEYGSQGAPSAPVSAPESSSSSNFSSDIGSAISSIAQTPGNVDPTNPTISTGVPVEFIEPSLDISDVAGGAVSRMSEFFKRKLKENQAVRQSTYGY